MPPSSTARKKPPSQMKRLIRAARSSASAASASGRTLALAPKTATLGRCFATSSAEAPANSAVTASASCRYSAAKRRSTSRAFDTWSYIHQPTWTVETKSSARKPSCSALLGSRFKVIGSPPPGRYGVEVETAKRADRSASASRSTSRFVCASDRNPISNADGASATPCSSSEWNTTP